MLLIPYIRFEFTTHCPSEEVLVRLGQVIQTRVMQDARPLSGKVRGVMFEIQARQRFLHRVPYLATLRGEVTQMGELSRVKGSIRAGIDEIVMLAAMVALAWSSGGWHDGAGLRFAAGLAIFYHVGGMLFGFGPTRDSLLETVRHAIVQAPGVVPSVSVDRT